MPASAQVAGSIEMVFCSIFGEDVELDCRAVLGPTSGWPFMMRLRIPDGAVWGPAARRLLCRWAEENAIVATKVQRCRDEGRIRLSDATSSVLLDVPTSGSVLC